MTATLLTLSLLLTATPADRPFAERSARLVAGEQPTAFAAGSRLALLETRRELVDGMPGVGGPVGMLLGSAGVSGLAALFGATQLREAIFKIQSGSAGTMAFGVQGGVVMVILFAVLCLGSQALGVVGSWMLARNIKRRSATEAEVTKIDAELTASVGHPKETE